MVFPLTAALDDSNVDILPINALPNSATTANLPTNTSGATGAVVSLAVNTGGTAVAPTGGTTAVYTNLYKRKGNALFPGYQPQTIVFVQQSFNAGTLTYPQLGYYTAVSAVSTASSVTDTNNSTVTGGTTNQALLNAAVTFDNLYDLPWPNGCSGSTNTNYYLANCLVAYNFWTSSTAQQTLNLYHAIWTISSVVTPYAESYIVTDNSKANFNTTFWNGFYYPAEIQLINALLMIYSTPSLLRITPYDINMRTVPRPWPVLAVQEAVIAAINRNS